MEGEPTRKLAQNEAQSPRQGPQMHSHAIKMPENLPKVYAIGAAGGFTPYDFRILFFDAGRFQPEAKVEVALSPLAARELRDWLDRLIKDFEKKVRKIEKSPDKDGAEPLQKKKGSRDEDDDGSAPASSIQSMRMFG